MKFFNFQNENSFTNSLASSNSCNIIIRNNWWYSSINNGESESVAGVKHESVWLNCDEKSSLKAIYREEQNNSVSDNNKKCSYNSFLNNHELVMKMDENLFEK